MAATTLLAGAAFAASAGASAQNATAAGTAISHLATTTTASGEARGDAISTAARKSHSTR